MFKTQESIMFNVLGTIDAIKVPRIHQFSVKHKALIDGCHPHNLITRSEMEDKSGIVEII
jgi:hypothetical protein